MILYDADLVEWKIDHQRTYYESIQPSHSSLDIEYLLQSSASDQLEYFQRQQQNTLPLDLTNFLTPPELYATQYYKGQIYTTPRYKGQITEVSVPQSPHVRMKNGEAKGDAGGLQASLRKLVSYLYKHGYLANVVSPYFEESDPQNIYPIVPGDQMYAYYNLPRNKFAPQHKNDQFLLPPHDTYIQDKIIRGVLLGGSHLIDAQYYVAGYHALAAKHALKVSGYDKDIDVIYQGHTWHRQFNQDPESWDCHRDAAERKIIREAGLIFSSSRWEKALIATGYEGILTPEQFEEKIIQNYLGIDTSFHKLGAMGKEKREDDRRKARRELTDSLEKQDLGESAKKIRGITDDTTVFGFVGRMKPDKSPDKVLEAFIQTMQKEENLDAALILVGPGIKGEVYFDTLLKRIDELPDYIKQRVIFTDQQAGILCQRITHVGLHFVDSETYGMVPVEIQASGNMMIATQHPSLAEITNQDTRTDEYKPILVDPNNTDTVADQMLFIIKNEDYRRQSGKLNHKSVKDHTWERSFDRRIGILEEKGFLFPDRKNPPRHGVLYRPFKK